MKPVPAGMMKHLCAIQERATTRGTYGEQADTWSAVAGGSVWMAIMPISGRELQAAQQLNTSVSHLIQMRYDARWADPVEMAKRRVVYGTRIFNIHASLNIQEIDTWIHLLCSEGVNNG